MKKLLFLLAALVALPMQAQILYRISGNGLEKPSYIVGTYHLADGSFVDSIPGARQVMTDVEQVCGELSMADMLQPDSVAALQQAMMLPEGKTLKDLLTSDQLERLDAYTESLIGLKLTNPMLFGQMGQMNPQALSTNFEVLSVLKRMQGAFNPQNTIDNYFQVQALQSGKSVIGFENVAFQSNVLFGMPLDRQVELLMCMVDNAEYYESLSVKLSDAYYAQDLDGIEALYNEEVGKGCDSTPAERDALIDGRNRNWAKLMPEIMSQKSTLFAVGCAHLPGEVGVLNLLSAAGYTVEAVNK